MRREVATTLVAGKTQSCAITSAGAARCWGWNYFGQLGDGTTADRHRPVGVAGLGSGVSGLRDGAVAIAAGGRYSCALTRVSGVECWGGNSWGQLGDGTDEEHHTPVSVLGLASGVKAIAGGAGHVCALTVSGEVKCWGYNRYGQLGNGASGLCGDDGCYSLMPVTVTGLGAGVVSIAAGDYHTCAVLANGVAKCWGWNYFGQLGDGTKARRLRPVRVRGLSSVVALAAGWRHSCALTSQGTVKCWGENIFGQLGDDTTVDHITPLGVIGFGGKLRCVVPDVLKMPLRWATREISGDHCRVGTVTLVSSAQKANTVVSQSRPPGTRLKPGARVDLRVSRGR